VISLSLDETYWSLALYKNAQDPYCLPFYSYLLKTFKSYTTTRFSTPMTPETIKIHEKPSKSMKINEKHPPDPKNL
jgi:hypothetical protein